MRCPDLGRAFPAAALLLSLLPISACNGEEVDGPPVLVPETFDESWREVRNCRFSHEHELRRIRVLADPAALEPYTTWSVPFPPGATLVKAEYESDDMGCQEPIGYTGMRKLPADKAPGDGDWQWQRTTPARKVFVRGDEPNRCIGCHVDHCAPPYGFDMTCAEELTIF